MEFKLGKGSLASFATDVAVVTCFERDGAARLERSDGGVELDRALGGELTKLITSQKFTGKEGKTIIVPTFGKVTPRYVLILGLGTRKDCTIERLRKAGAIITKECDRLHAASFAVVLEQNSLNGLASARRLQAVIEGAFMGSYRFERYREADARSESTFARGTFLTAGPTKLFEKSIDLAQSIGRAIHFSRDLSNTPGNDLTPTILAQHAKRVAHDLKLGIDVWGTAELKKERMGAFLAVAQGTAEPPALVHLTYRPRGKVRAKVALVGKGVTFDTGGISIKPSKSMHEMKYDMSGAAVVLATLQAAAQAKLPVAIDAYLGATENMPDAKAVKPGDIVTARNGKTVEIINTDAEGRLVLADTLTVAAEKKPDYLIDLATLTGGASYAVGELYAAILGSDQKLVDRLLAASANAGERLWQLPLEKQYLKTITKGPADIANSGGSTASTIMGGLFLSQFVGDCRWAHFDIASCAWTNEDNTLASKGATGAMIPTLISFLSSL
ncbi:MAG: leucyl aminopeptidase [Deltaproteobacteria bacterium]|nr:leucyl aminopeptidase [Deltaproteobacteria bacterium]